MALRLYRDFELVADDVKTDTNDEVTSFSVWVFDSPVGQGVKESVTVPAALRRSIRWVDEDLTGDLRRQMDLGRDLSRLLLPEQARLLFARSLARLRSDEGLRVRLRLAAELTDIPWEYLYLPDEQASDGPEWFLALDRRVSIVRHEALPIPADLSEAPAERRVVIAMATPQPHDIYARLNALPSEQRELATALATVPGVQTVLLPNFAVNGPGADGEIPGATLRQVLSELAKGADVFHFGGHGESGAATVDAAGSQAGRGVLVFADEQNQAVRVSAGQLAVALRGLGTRLVVLSACDSGRRDGHNVWNDVASAVLAAGVPAVVAMQFSIKDRAAAVFSGALYQALVAGFSIDEAVFAGRLAMRAEADASTPDVHDWGIPVLYLRAPGGQIFEPVRDVPSRDQAREAVEHLFDQHVAEVAPSGHLIGTAGREAVNASVRVDQQVAGDVQGFMLGSMFFSVQGGKITVTQRAGRVTGTMIGAMFDSLGGGRPASPSLDPITELERLMTIDQKT